MSENDNDVPVLDKDIEVINDSEEEEEECELLSEEFIGKVFYTQHIGGSARFVADYLKQSYGFTEYVASIQETKLIRSTSSEATKLHLQLLETINFYWMTKRGNFPFDIQVEKSDEGEFCAINHIASEWHLTQKNYLVRTLFDAFGMVYILFHPETHIISTKYNTRPWNELGKSFVRRKPILNVTPLVNEICDDDYATTSIGSLTRESLLKFINAFTKKNKAMKKKLLQNNDNDVQEDYIERWILKPARGSCGRSINILEKHYLQDDKMQQVKDAEFFKKVDKLVKFYNELNCDHVVVQRYVDSPFLYNNCKFDIRVYVLVASIRPFIAFFAPGYLRICTDDYSNDNVENHNAHITNFHVARDHPKYNPETDSIDGVRSRISFEEFLDYLKENDVDWNNPSLLRSHYRKNFFDLYKKKFSKYDEEVEEEEEQPAENNNNNESDDDKNKENVSISEYLVNRIGEILSLSIYAGKLKMYKTKATGGSQFGILGTDLLLDNYGNMTLLEYTKSPALRMSPEFLNELHSDVLSETVDIILNIESERNKHEDRDNIPYEDLLNSTKHCLSSWIPLQTEF